MSNKPVYLVDATAFCYRAFYALRGLSTSFGQPTNAVYGFVNILNKIIKEEKPDFCACCFDVSRDTFRQKKFAAYKIQRPPMPDELSSQIPLIKEVIGAYGIVVLEKEGFEADDIIASLCRQARSQGLEVVIVSSDKDILQLVGEGVMVFSPYKDGGTWYDSAKIMQRYGVAAQKIPDIIALMGDSADNIPGVPGIGERTAAELLRRYGSVEGLLAAAEEIPQEKLRESVRGHIDQVKLSRELAQLDSAVDLGVELGQLRVKAPNTPELLRIFKRLEFKRLLKTLPPAPQEEVSLAAAEEARDEDLTRLLGDSNELIFLCREDDFAFLAQGKVFSLPRPGEQLKKILADKDINKVSHDLKQAKITLQRRGLTLEGLWFDTLIAAHLINPSAAGYGLADLALEYLPDPGSLPPAMIISRLKPSLEGQLKEKALDRLFRDLEIPLSEVLAEMQLRGILLDLPLLKDLAQQIEKKLIGLREEIYALCGGQFNLNSPQQLRQVLFEKLKLPVVKRSKTGPSTDEEVLNALAEKHKLPRLLLEYRQLAKLKNTYVDPLPGLVDEKTGRVHTSFNQAATETGRLSSSNPNLQNLPVKTEVGRIIRKAVVAPPGQMLISCDYSQVELRILAHLAQDENLSRAFLAGKDIHCATAALIYGTPEAEVPGEMREAAKRVNFGIVYGLTAYGLSRDLGIPPQEAQAFIDAYFLRYPKVQDYIRSQIELCRKEGFVKTLLGRRRYLPEINNKNQAVRQFAERQAVNTPIQGSAADLIKLAMLELHRAIGQKGLKARMVLQVHDELVFEAPQEETAQLRQLAKEKMEGALKLSVPLKVDIKQGKNWLEMEEL
jgi:DNA polymerase-1